jgi:beta-mannosidase
VQLDGPWRVAVTNPDLERLGGDPDLDDSGWTEVPVPGHWTQVPELSGSAGPVLYRRRFSHPPPEDGQRHWLVLEGIINQGDVWLDGAYLGDTEGYFVAHRFEVTEHLAASEDHLLAVGVACPPAGRGRSKRALTGSLQTGPLRPAGNPGGIWRPVHLDRTGPVAIRHSRLQCTRATAERAEVTVRLVVLAPEALEVDVETTIVDPHGAEQARLVERRPLATGENRLELRASVDEPQLWWPAALGAADRYRVQVRVLVDGVESDQRRWTTGLRRVSLDDFTCRINGERLFCKGIALGPTSAHLGALDPEIIVRDLQAARDAGFDLVRVHGHIARPELYDAADELGLLLWQDLPLVGGYATGIRSQARRQCREAVDLLGHHPSVVIWCAHDEPNGPPVSEPVDGRPAPLPTATRRVLRHLAPSWNRSVLDPQLRRELRSHDRTRPVVSSAGMLPHPIRLAGTDSHLGLGWRAGRAEDLSRVLRRWPRLGRFVSAFGTQSVVPGDHPYGTLQLHGAERASFERYVPRASHGSGREWAAATRRYQAEVLRSHIETLRRLKYRPTGGFCAFALVDGDDAVGYGILDARRRTKPAYAAVADACAPVIVVADPPPAVLSPGDHLDLAVHAVSDLRDAIDEVRVTARVRSGDHVLSTAWAGRLAADSVAFVGRLVFEVPAGHGPLSIDLELEAEGVAATNRYRVDVIPRAETVDRPRTPSGR